MTQFRHQFISDQTQKSKTGIKRFYVEKSTFMMSPMIMVSMPEYKNIPFRDQFLCQETRLPFPSITCKKVEYTVNYFNVCVCMCESVSVSVCDLF